MDKGHLKELLNELPGDLAGELVVSLLTGQEHISKINGIADLSSKEQEETGEKIKEISEKLRKRI